MAFNPNDFIIPMKKMSFNGYSFAIPDFDAIQEKRESKMPYVIPPSLLDGLYEERVEVTKPKINPDHIANMATMKASIIVIALGICIGLLIG